MSFTSKILYFWHYARRNYHHELVESCLDHKLKAKLKDKFEYHNNKVEQMS